jgi:WNK lysine deficient protein kinase
MSEHHYKEVERSPDGRYIRYDSKLGDGAYKAVWLAYDTELGIEVAWCLVETKKIPPRERERIKSETEILSHIHHQHIINFYQVWENPATEQIVFTTERVTSGSLKQYINRVKPLKLKIIKKWCRQILKGLEYLHSQNPPVIHRDLSKIFNLGV